MAWQVVKAVLDHSNAPGAARMVLTSLGERADSTTGQCWPSNSDTAKRSGLSVRSVQRAKQTLVDLGELAIEPQAAPHGADRYTILLYTNKGDDRLSPLESEGVTDCHGGDDKLTPEGDKLSDGGRQGVTRTSKGTKTKPSIEPIEKFSIEDLIWQLGDDFADLVDLPQKIIDEDNCPTRGRHPLRLTEVVPVVLDLAAKHEGDFGATERAARWHFHMDGREA